ncbi:tetratricopeptide repeat protein [Reichenbachiella sp.]|uniref:tetratricopeptide repeat protein n=1 Tax=Reichenbachiella sp. TaxID=2184521 RepID=UPI003BB20A86
MNNLSDNDLKLIEGKVDETLNENDSAQFTQRLNESDSFKEEFELQKAVIDTLIKSNQRDLKDELSSYLVEPRQVKKIKTSQLLAAAVSILIISVFAYTINSNSSSNHAELFQEHFEVYPAPPVTRGSKNLETRVEIFEEYRNKNFAKAIKVFESTNIIEKSPLYKASCHLKLNETLKAISILEIASSSEDKSISQTAEWYLGLAFLKNNQLKKCKEVLNKIVLNEQLFHKEAELILGELGD